VPDAKTLWLFREQLKAVGRMEYLFKQFTEFLAANGYAAKQGQIVDASIVAAHGSATAERKTPRSRTRQRRMTGQKQRSGKRC